MPWTLRAAYDRDVRAGLARLRALAPITEADLASLPPPVQRYVRLAGAVGQPRVGFVRARMHGRIRSAPDAAWMPFEAEQHDFFDEPSRFFYLTASRGGLPIRGYHRYAGSEATMRVRLLGLVTVAHAAGPAMTRAETVTLFNDMCLLAPAALVEAPVRWQAEDDRAVAAAYTNAGLTIRARLAFNGAGELVNFESDDRGELEDGGARMTAARWSTPLSAYRQFGPMRLAGHGEARYQDTRGDWSYIELDVTEVTHETARQRRA